MTTAVTTALAGEPVTRPASVFRVPDFRRLWVGETVSQLGSSVSSFALPLVALTSLHAGVVALGFLGAAAWLPWLLVGLPAGAWVDRLPRRPVMMVADGVSLALVVSVPVAAWLGVLTMTQLLVVALLAGVADVFFATAYRAFLPSLLPLDRLADGNAHLQGAQSAANVVGPGLAGALAQVFGAVDALLCDALGFAASLTCLARIEARETRSAPAPRRSLRRDIATGVRFVLDDRLLRVVTAFGGAANLVLTAFGTVELPFLVRHLGLRPGTAGLLLAAVASGGVLGAFLAPAAGRRFGTARTLLAAKVALAPVGLLIPLSGSGWRLALFVGPAFVLVGGIVAGNVTSTGFLPRYCPPDLMGRVTTTMQVVNFGAIPVGAVVGGLLAARLGYVPTLWLLFTAFVGACAILLLAPIRHCRDLPVREVSATAAPDAAGRRP